MKQIPLTQGAFAVVDDEDFAFLSQYSWYLISRKYAARDVRDDGTKKTVYMHRIVASAPNGMDVDHINRNQLDNRRSNLRVCTKSQNLANRPKQTNNKSGFKGVYYHKPLKKWTAQIAVAGRSIHLGVFKDPREAAMAYNKSAAEYHGEFAHINVL